MAKRQKMSENSKLLLSKKSLLTGATQTNEFLIILPTDSEQEHYYILNVLPIKRNYESKWLSKISYTFNLSKEIFPHINITQLFDLEILDWQPIKLSLDKKPELRSDLSCNGHLSNSSHKLSVSRKTVLEQLQKLHDDISKLISENNPLSCFSLSYSNSFHQSNNGYGNDYEVYERFDIERLESNNTELHIQWYKDIDQYIMRIYNDNANTLKDNLLIRQKAKALCKDNGALLGTLIIRRLIGFCKVSL